MERARRGKAITFLDLEQEIKDLEKYIPPDYEAIRNELIAFGYVQCDPRFQGVAYWKLPAWFILKIHSSQIKIHKKFVNVEAVATAKLAATVANMFLKKGAKPAEVKSFLPYDTDDYSPEIIFLREQITKRTAQLIVKDLESGEMPPYIAKMVKGSPIEKICNELLGNG